jgi:hypothetical protein
MSSPGGSSAINEGYTCRPIEIPPVDQWKPDVDFHDSNKINGLDFPSRIRQSRFSSCRKRNIWPVMRNIENQT